MFSQAIVTAQSPLVTISCSNFSFVKATVELSCIMKQHLFIFLLSIIQILLFERCDSGSVKNTIATDSVTIATGEVLFNNACSGCHNFRQHGIGPQLAGLTEEVSPKWIHDFIKNSQQLISSGDVRAVQLY